jgi:hypothetical protein
MTVIINTIQLSKIKMVKFMEFKNLPEDTLEVISSHYILLFGNTIISQIYNNRVISLMILHIVMIFVSNTSL